MQNPLVKKTIVEPSKHFPGGEREFSDWLNNHLDEIGDLLGLRLEKGEREAEVGPFSADIVAKNVSGDIEENTVIENQFNETDHDHLGKLITYSTRYNAKKIIWVAPDFVPKHIDALNWLNQNSSGDISFFGVKLELIRIEDSKVAHNFSVVVQPADWTNEERAHGGLRPLDKFRLTLFERYIEEYEKIQSKKVRSRAKTKKWIEVERINENFILYCQHYTNDEYVSVYVMITRNEESDNDKKLFNKLKKFKNELEEDVGEELEWDPPKESSNRSRYYICANYSIGEFESVSESQLIKAAIWMADTSKKFVNAFTKIEKKL